jgi:sRNA-binding protein
MTSPEPEARDETAALLSEHGFVITEEGKAKARAKLEEAERRISAERREQLRRFGPDADAGSETQ